ncbi:Outer membrane protein porin [Paraburkholderia piptadeniae]|uniref:Outer membrane protein porin n=1 Tax=Paraburkholderia piptadeniae TaxID=1701573 RepID=A0A1N7RY06_9BURK|nr:porin [Paraburkholderia piptadeniae]SIT39971.1 Outer membrane protein porin [Paraburkholderia piptadeniae]
MKTSVSRALRTILKAGAVGALLAVASASSFAQSSVQLYGQVDEWVGATKFPGSKTAWNVSGGGMSTSYWGIKGSEDLGNGYKAIFTLEDFFRAQNGKFGRFDGDTFFGRNAYVGVESPFGTVTAGRLTTHLFVSTILFNPFIDSYVFSPMVYHVFLGLGTFPTYTTDMGVVGDSGWNNAVQYSTPDFNGLSGSAMYAFGNTAGQNSSKKYSAQFLYFHGPFAATGVYQYVNFNNTPADLGSLVAGLKSQSVAQLGLSYDLKFVKFYGQYMYTKNDQEVGSWHVNTAQGGVSVPLGTGTVMASYAYSRDAGGLDQMHQSAAIGYDYPLSKRTDVYAAYLYDKYTSQSSGYTAGVGIRAKF